MVHIQELKDHRREELICGETLMAGPWDVVREELDRIGGRHTAFGSCIAADGRP